MTRSTQTENMLQAPCVLHECLKHGVLSSHKIHNTVCAGKDFRDGAVVPFEMISVHSSSVACLLFGFLPYFLPFSL
jgi:hypothetical protein